MTLTPHQAKAAAFIRNYTLLRGESPTLAEIGEAMGVTKVTALEHVNALHRKGAIVRTAKTMRNLKVVAKLPDENRPTKIPFVGEINGHPPIPAPIPIASGAGIILGGR